MSPRGSRLPHTVWYETQTGEEDPGNETVTWYGTQTLRTSLGMRLSHGMEHKPSERGYTPVEPVQFSGGESSGGEEEKREPKHDLHKVQHTRWDGPGRLCRVHLLLHEERHHRHEYSQLHVLHHQDTHQRGGDVQFWIWNGMRAKPISVALVM